MSNQIQICDETTSGKSEPIFVLEFLTERITVRELIRSRVYQEVKDYNTSKPEYFRGLIQPTDAEQTVNGFRLSQVYHIDWEKQFELAIAAFEGNGFMILVDDQQVTELEEKIEIKLGTSVSFLKLIPLVGG